MEIELLNKKNDRLQNENSLVSNEQELFDKMVDADNQYRDLNEKFLKKEKEMKDMANRNVIRYKELDTEF